MKFAFGFGNAGPFSKPAAARGLAELLEETGFESVWTVEHVVVPVGYQSEYPYSPDGKMPGGEHVPIPDPLIWLTYVGAVTTKLRLGTGILILPQRNPVVLAKEVATLDRLTGGRMELGVGVGWLEEEFDALGVPFAQRGARTDEYVDVLRRLWREEQTEYDGRFTKFAAVKSYPKPTQVGGPPIVIGGHTAAAARRAGRIGDGFFPGRGGDELVALLEEMRKAAREAGRDPDLIEISGGGGLSLDAVKQAADLGVSRYLIPPLSFDLDDLRDKLHRFADEVMTNSP